jgi:hypothetical protein
MAAQGTRLHFCQPPASRGVLGQRRDDEALSVGLEVQIGFVRDSEEVQDGPIDDDPGTVPDSLQALRHALSMNDVHNVVQRDVRRTPCRSAAGGRPRPTVSQRCNGLLGIPWWASRRDGLHAFGDDAIQNPVIDAQSEEYFD